MNKHKGFTLVELLIVIVVIAILAAITVVAYNGIQNKANDTTVQNDLHTFANLVMQYYASNGDYPAPAGKTKPPGTENFYVSSGSYATDVHNFIYCEGPDASGAPTFTVAARSKSGTYYAYYADGGLKKYTGAWGSVADICPALGVPLPPSGYYYAYGYNGSSHAWWPGWTH